MEVNLVYEGAKFMVLGMSVVFSFLLFLVFVLMAQAKIITKYFPDKEEPVCDIKSASSKKENDNVIAAITAAIIHYRK